MTANRRPVRVFTIIDLTDERHPFGLVDPSDEVVRVDAKLEWLADHAFEELGADRVLYGDSVVRSDSRFQKEA